MRKYMEVADGIIISVGECLVNGITISDEEYKEILLTIKNKPTAPNGYGYKLRTDMTWEMYELPEQTEGDSTGYTEDELLAMTNAELERILATYGLTATANKSNMIRLILYMQQGGGTDA